jgi:hypothetical protein
MAYGQHLGGMVMKKPAFKYYGSEQWKLYDDLIDAKVALIKNISWFESIRKTWTIEHIKLYLECHNMKDVIDGYLKAMMQGRVQY